MSLKEYDQHQMQPLPPSLDELMPASDLVRVVSAVVNLLNPKQLEKAPGLPVVRLTIP